MVVRVTLPSILLVVVTVPGSIVLVVVRVQMGWILLVVVPVQLRSIQLVLRRGLLFRRRPHPPHARLVESECEVRIAPAARVICTSLVHGARPNSHVPTG